MGQPADLYFALIAPACVVLFGFALLACWYVQRRQQRALFLLWLVGGYVLLATALAAQSLMSNAQLSHFALMTACLYLLGTWSLAQGMSLRLGSAGASVAGGLLIAVVALSVLFYFSRIENDLWVRVQCLALAMALQLTLAMPAFLKADSSKDWLERGVRWAYGLNVCYALFRPAAVSLLPVHEVQELTRSGYWLLTQAIALLFAMWFAVGLLACSVRDVMTTLREERNRDSLTRLLNRRAFMEAAESRLADQRLVPWAVVAVDIDHFKYINDNWGHAAGDQVLQQLAQLLTQQVRDCDLVARFGGEEFVLLLSRVQLFEAQAIVERVRERLQSQVLGGLAAQLKVTASFGIAALSSAQDFEQALARADALLYQAKKAGRDCVMSSAQDESELQWRMIA